MKNYLQKRNSYIRDTFFDAFDDFFKPVFYDNSADSMRTDIKETENGYQLDVEMPGFDKKDIKISLENGYLTVSAQKSSKEEEGKKERKVYKEGVLCIVQPQLLCRRRRRTAERKGQVRKRYAHPDFAQVTAQTASLAQYRN